MNDTFVFYNENSAEAYYWVLKNFFDDPYVYKGVHLPVRDHHGPTSLDRRQR